MLRLPTVFHDDIVQGIGMSVGAAVGMLLAYKTRRSLTVDRMTVVAGILGVLVCLAWSVKELVDHFSVVGWNRLPHVIGFVFAVICGFGALCVIGVGLCGLRARHSAEEIAGRQPPPQSVRNTNSSPGSP